MADSSPGPKLAVAVPSISTRHDNAQWKDRSQLFLAFLIKYEETNSVSPEEQAFLKNRKPEKCQGSFRKNKEEVIVE